MSEISFQTKTDQKLPEHYSGKYKGSFAYLTIKDRLPVILVKVIDSLCRNKNEIVACYGETATEEMKKVIGRLSALQNEMVTNKAIRTICDSNADAPLWNDYFQDQAKNNVPTWFDSSWLYSECYFYRRLKEAFLLSSVLGDYDPFHQQKEESFLSTLDAASFLSSTLESTLSQLEINPSEIFAAFRVFLEASLWGNKWDLSITAGKENITDSNPLSELDDLRAKILVNHTQELYDILRSKNKFLTIDYILDNAGFELFSDLCFMRFLLESKLVHKINIYPKMMPWFVSDTLEKDIEWLLHTLSQSGNASLEKFSETWSTIMKSHEVLIMNEMFWTLPHDFSEMQTADSRIYHRLSKSDLIIFKGDLNYRKLTGDRQWEESSSFEESLNGFLPSNLVALRTIKADVVVGLEPGTVEELSKKSPGWKYTGNYALIQCFKK